LIVRANTLLQPDESDLTGSIAGRCGCRADLVYRASRQYEEEGIERVLCRKKRETPPVPICRKTGLSPVPRLLRVSGHTQTPVLSAAGNGTAAVSMRPRSQASLS
jgi:hypothetical protein